MEFPTEVVGYQVATAIAGGILSLVFGSKWWAARRAKNGLITRLVETVCDVAVREVEAVYVKPTKRATGEAKLSSGNQDIAQTRAEVIVKERLADAGVGVPVGVKNGAVREGVKSAVRRMQNTKVD